METKTQILLIDNKHYERHLVFDALKEHAFEITVADMHENFEMLSASRLFDLILVGNIPDVNELKLLRIAKENNPDLPVIIITHNDSENKAVQNMRMGALGYIITSENSVKDLAQTIRTQLKHKRLLQEKKLPLHI
jgi:DNA-binding NtrC family response regulator